MRGFTQYQIEKIVEQAKYLGLIQQKFSNPYIVGHGENFIGLTELGLSTMKVQKP